MILKMITLMVNIQMMILIRMLKSKSKISLPMTLGVKKRRIFMEEIKRKMSSHQVKMMRMNTKKH
jgi:hypothetical protein